jgi:hypothetical protein
MYYTDDPVADFDRYDRDTIRELRTRHLCCCCMEPIYDEFAVKLDRRWYCRTCEDMAWALIRQEYLEATDD